MNILSLSILEMQSRAKIGSSYYIQNNTLHYTYVYLYDPFGLHHLGTELGYRLDIDRSVGRDLDILAPIVCG